MFESLRIFGILIYKSFLVRKRNWVVVLIAEILLPAGLLYMIWSGLKSGEDNLVAKEVKFDMKYEKQSLDDLLQSILNDIPTFYAPENAFTSELMANVQKCFKTRLKPVRGFSTESDFNAFYRNSVQMKEDFGGKPHVVIFDESTDRSTKRLNYKIRYQRQIMEIDTSLFNDNMDISTETKLYQHYILTNSLTQMQICVERSFVDMKTGKKPVPDLYIQRVPDPAHKKQIPFGDQFRMQIDPMLAGVITIAVVIETLRATKEKFCGVHVLMAMNGISNTLNLLSWIISSVLFLSVSLLLMIFLTLTKSPGIRLPYMYYGDPVLLYLSLIFYLAHSLTYGIHVSAYFSKTTLVTVALWILYELGSKMHIFAFSDNTRYLAPYVGIIIPHILFSLLLDEIKDYENKAEGIHWYNLFMNTNSTTKIGGSVGMILILSVIGIIFHFLLAIYLYAINPGKYGAAKHPLFFLKFQRKESNDGILESLDYDGSTEKNFERVTEGAYIPGIQIRNLQKTYKISLFSKKKVYALRGLSVDFYKGQITSLLGHNGAGKTTMMSILAGMTSPTDGVVLINSKDLKTNASEIIKDMGLCTQENLYFSELTVSEQLLIFAMVKRKGKSRSTVRELLNSLNLSDKKDAMPNTLSGGQKRRLCLGMALVGDTSTLILDEPTSGLDPESRRVIWNILLKMRGQKTILISTHDMEEADVLGDRIAIMHTGQLKSCGTALFLKRMIGQNTVEITLSIEPRSDPEKIRSGISKDAVIIQREANRMIVKIPNSPSLPDTLDSLEKKKKELGISGFSLALISLEQVFLKITQENDDPPNPPETDDTEEARVTGCPMFVQSVRALLQKKLTYALKNYFLMIQKIYIAVAALFLQSLAMMTIYIFLKTEGKLLAISLDLYHTPDVPYTSHYKSLGDRYQTVIQNLRGNPIQVTNNTIQNALLLRAKDNLVIYNNYLIAAAEINETSVTALYSEFATFSLPISVNLLFNAILKNLMGSDYSISVSQEDLPLLIKSYVDISGVFSYTVTVFFLPVFYLAVGYYVAPPNRETMRGVKRMQLMTGISGATYWGTTFLFDFIEYVLLAMLVVGGLVCVDFAFKYGLYGPTEVLFEFVLLLLFGSSLLPFLYILSFLRKKTSTILTYMNYVPIAILAIDMGMAYWDWTNQDSSMIKNVRSIQKGIFLAVPYINFFHSQVSFYRTVETNARCHRLPNDFYESVCSHPGVRDICCSFSCRDGKCKWPRGFFEDSDYDANMKSSVMYLCATPILWFIILALLESRIFQKMRGKSIEEYRRDSDSDEQVQQEKSMIYERIQALSGSEFSVGNIQIDVEGDTIVSNSDVESDTTVNNVDVEEKPSSRNDSLDSKGQPTNKKTSTDEQNPSSRNDSLDSKGQPTNKKTSTDEQKPSSRNDSLDSKGQPKNQKSSTDEQFFLVYELKKSYGSVKAVKEVSFGVSRRECFGLLGVNGAGKSTTFRMMTGEELSEHGIMYMNDKDFGKNEKYFLSQMGYCPQHDAILKRLNTYDHLKLFARLRGIPEKQVKKEVQAWIEKLNLTACAKQPSITYSGGNKRRLNIAMALIGNPNLMLMDEPTTGVDPGARRSLWNVIKTCQMAGQAVILTSHSMEECEALCDRLAIMVDGKLVCIGASAQLKQRFGAGYDVKIKMDPEKAKDQVDSIKEDMNSKLNCELTDENIGNLLYHVSPAGTTWRKMYDVMNGMKSKYDCIDDFSVLSSSLEQLFLMFAKSASGNSPT